LTLPLAGVFCNPVSLRSQSHFAEINARRFDSVRFQNFRNLKRAFALDAQCENSAHDFGSYRVNHPHVFIIWTFQIPVNATVGKPFTVVAFGLIHRLDFAAGVAGVSFRHNVKKRSKFVTLAVFAVNVVADRDKADAMLTKENLGIKNRALISTYLL